jgi:hypothetical protein
MRESMKDLKIVGCPLPDSNPEPPKTSLKGYSSGKLVW